MKHLIGKTLEYDMPGGAVATGRIVAVIDFIRCVIVEWRDADEEPSARIALSSPQIRNREVLGLDELGVPLAAGKEQPQ